MRIDFPQAAQIPGLRRLWQDAFGDSEAFLDQFFRTAFDFRRCRCISDGEIVTAALYWFDVSCHGQPMAYIYAVATDPAYRNRGLCRKLMEDTRMYLGAAGYCGILLVPQEDALRQMYASMGYETCSAVHEFCCTPDSTPVAMHRIDAEEYARLRRQRLPRGSVIQEGENLAFLQTFGDFYRGEDFLAVLTLQEQSVFCPELLGNPAAAAGIVTACAKRHGTFRTPGTGTDFAMFLPLSPDAEKPNYFAFAFD